MSKIAIIGAGSTVFAKNIIGDVLSYPELQDVEFALMDIDPDRLAVTQRVTHRLAEALGARPRITATTDRRRALEGAKYVICMIQVGGYRPATVIDFEIPKKYGLRQTIGDTLGIGGIMRALRTIPVLIDIARDMEEVCPDALLINYANPMAMNQWALSRATRIRTVGLCHSVQGTARQLAADLGIPYEEMSYLAAGINHMAFYLRLERNGDDLYPALRRLVAEGRVPPWNRVRYDMMMRLGYFVTESSEHFSEYVPYFIRRDRPDLITRYNIPLDEYPRRCEEQIAGWEALRHSLEHGSEPLSHERSHEYAPLIIHSMETGTPRTVYANVPNAGLITNLPAGAIVEVPCLADRLGVQPTHVGPLPVHLAALIQTNINVQAVAVEAALTGKREHVYHAAMLDPHTAAELTLDEIVAMVDELLAAHREWLPQFT
ncbi:MAG: alpha-glucosidase/alpha-galactosidase [Bacillota bacterium]